MAPASIGWCLILFVMFCWFVWRVIKEPFEVLERPILSFVVQLVFGLTAFWISQNRLHDYMIYFFCEGVSWLLVVVLIILHVGYATINMTWSSKLKIGKWIEKLYIVASYLRIDLESQVHKVLILHFLGVTRQTTPCQYAHRHL